MKTFDRVFIITIIMLIIIAAIFNIGMVSGSNPYSGRQYRVEIKRLASEIEKNGSNNIDL